MIVKIAWHAMYILSPVYLDDNAHEISDLEERYTILLPVKYLGCMVQCVDDFFHRHRRRRQQMRDV